MRATITARTSEAQRKLNVRNAVAKMEAARIALHDADETLRFALAHAETGHSDIAGCLNGLHSFVKAEVDRRTTWHAAVKRHGVPEVEAQAKHDLDRANGALADIETLRGVGFRFRK